MLDVADPAALAEALSGRFAVLSAAPYHLTLSIAKAARADAEGKAVGGACRQSGRAIEDCYSIYSWLPKAPIYEGWRDMDAYMRDNKLETVEPQLPPVAAPGTKRKVATTEETAASSSKKTTEKR